MLVLPGSFPCLRIHLSVVRRSILGSPTITSAVHKNRMFSGLVLTPSQLSKMPPNTTVPIDVSWFMPDSHRYPNAEYMARRIPGAQRMDLDEVASKHALGLKHMMPSSAIFAQACEEIGVQPTSHVVLYDTTGVFSSPRALFMFKAFGHRKASILNGGLLRWEQEGYTIEIGEPKLPKKSKYPEPKLDDSFIRDYDAIVNNAERDMGSNPTAELILDARSRGRFTGQDPEPRPGISSGHMPNALSLPFADLVEKAQGSSFTTLRNPDDLRIAVKQALGSQENVQAVLVDKERKVVNSCGSGMTAGVIWLALQELGVDSALYDESWTGYAQRPASKIMKN